MAVDPSLWYSNEAERANQDIHDDFKLKLERCIDAGVDDYASAAKAITPLPALPSHSKKIVFRKKVIDKKNYFVLAPPLLFRSNLFWTHPPCKKIIKLTLSNPNKGYRKKKLPWPLLFCLNLFKPPTAPLEKKSN